MIQGEVRSRVECLGIRAKAKPPEQRSGDATTPKLAFGSTVTFRDYYQGIFRSDLVEVVSALPSGHDLTEHGSVVIQPRTLSTENSFIRSLRRDRIDHLASALFWTILLDQVCYTYFSGQYWAFQQVTLYPKFHGDCPGGCYNNLHPQHILTQFGRRRPRLSVDAAGVIREEVFELFPWPLSAISPSELWKRCLQEVGMSDEA